MKLLPFFVLKMAISIHFERRENNDPIFQKREIENNMFVSIV